MENAKYNLIFDCDGTLVDSYPAIVDKVYTLFKNQGIECGKEEIREYSLRTTVGDCIEMLARRHGITEETIAREWPNLPEDFSIVTLCPHIKEILSNDKYRCFVYTHRGPRCRELFTLLGIIDYFEEIIDSSRDFKRKPSGEAVSYLVNKYSLDKERTFYVGDRSLDIECGIDAGVKTIFYNSSGLNIDCSKADFVINDPIEINEIL